VTESERLAFVQSMSTGIGGSSIASLLQPYMDVEYGCQRKLWYRLSQVEADYPEIENEPMALGSLLEHPIATAYSNITGRRLEEVPLKKHAEHDSLQVHVDRIIHPTDGDTRDTPGVGECKAIGDQMMQKVSSEGICADYLCQLMHGMLCHDLYWGSFVVGRRSQFAPWYLVQVMAKMEGRTPPPLREPRPIFWEHERDQDICDAILRVGPEFWSTLRQEDNIPARLEPDDERCGHCAWRKKCQGAALLESVDPDDNPKKPPLMPEILPLVAELRERHAVALEAEEKEEETKAVIKAVLDRHPAVSVMIDGKRKNITYRLRSGPRRLKADRIVERYKLSREKAIAAGLLGAELTPALAACYEQGMPTRPLLIAAVLPKKDKKVQEQDEIEDE